LKSVTAKHKQQAVLVATQYAPPRPARCTHAAAHLQSIAYTPGAQRALLHEYSWSTGSGLLWAVA